MKKVLIYSLLVICIIIFLLTQFGVQIGDVRLGKQIDLKIPQKTNFESSDFYKNYYSTDKLICLNTWATWCGPCVEEMPNLNKLKLSFSDTSILFLSLSIDDDSVKLNKFLNEKKFDFTDITLKNLEYRDAILNTLEGNKIDDYIPMKSVPNTYIIKHKIIIQKLEGEVDTLELRKIIEKNL